MGLTEKSAMTKHGFKGMHDFKGNFPYDDFFRKTHARLYFCVILTDLDMSCSPWPPPLLTLTKTSRGQTLGGNMDGFNVGSNMTAKQENGG